MIGRRTAFGLGLAVILMAGLAGGLLLWKGDSLMGLLGLRSQNKMAELLPAERTLVYAGMALNIRNQQGFQTIQRLYLDNPDFQSLFDEAKAGMETSNGMDFETEIQPWLGTEVGMAVIVPEPTEEVDDLFGFTPPAFVVGLASKDDAKARDFILAQIERVESEEGAVVVERSHNGVSYWVEEKTGYDWQTPRAVTLYEGMVLHATDEATLQAVIDQGQASEGALAQSDAFQRLRNALPSEALALITMNQSSYMDMLSNMVGGLSMFPMGNDQFDTMQAQSEMLLMTGVSLVLEREGLRFDMAQLYDESKLTDEMRSLYDESHSDALLPYVPSDALLFTTMTNVDSMVAQYQAQLELMPNDEEGVDTVDMMMESIFGPGFDMEGDLAAWVGEDLLITINPSGGAELPVSGWMMMDSRDLAASQGFIERMSEQMSMELSPQAVGPHSFQLAQDSWSEEAMLAFGHVDDRLVVTMPGEAATQFAQPLGSTIKDNAGYQRLMGHLDSGYNSLFYLSFDEIERVMAPEMGLNASELAEFRAVIGPLVAFGATNSARMDNGLVRGRAYLLLEE
ncbi:MAG: DUF3352 domain-containing protein [Anaerolineales bacterium]|nr:DUF3352 domain-containing protein [Anaerolineales bacterium]MCB9129027.1 DUF3352 domain-containing protein [Ardenticatenales bacterium]